VWYFVEGFREVKKGDLFRVVQASDGVLYCCKELCFTGAVFSESMLVAVDDLVFFKEVDNAAVDDVF